MDQQAKYFKAADILDLSVLSSADDSRIDISENHLRTQIQKQKNQGAAMSEEELKIRGELESDVERDLEEEIKDGIYHLALRLHRLYQHRRERNAHHDISESGDHNEKDKTFSEVNISIKMEGGTKIVIKETKKEAPDNEKGQPQRPRSSRSKNSNTVQGIMLGSKSNGKNFDNWAKSLRAGPGSGSDPAFVNRKIERPYEAKLPSNEPGFCMNHNLENTRRNLVSATGSGQRKGNIGLNNKVLDQPGWKW